MRKPCFLIIILLFSVGVFAQTNQDASCGQKQAMETWLSQNPTARQFQQQIENKLSQFRKSITEGTARVQRTNAVVTLPVVIHIIHNNGSENISDAQAIAAIQHLNEAFANTGFYDPSQGVNTQIQFCMAQRDPSGNLTNGITRNVSSFTVMNGPSYYSDDLNVKNINRWDPKCYINIWLVKSIPGSVAGYAYLPSAHGSNVDGIIVEAAYFGSSYTNDVIMAHEMGHYLGLYHTFEGSCTNNDCTTDGDKVCDTPPDQSTAGVGCSTSVNSCTTDILSGFSTDQNDLTQDYMDYGNFNCMKVFTQGQSDRMNWFIQNVRKSLLDCKSCLPPCPAPVTANFSNPGSTVLAGSSYTFTNLSANAASYEWYVNGVLQSTAVSYTFNFITTGTYIIKLVAKTGNTLCDDIEKTITITATCPVTTSFTKSATILPCGTNISFTNTSSNANGYEWYVNGLLQSTTLNFIYTSSTAGKYEVKLIEKNAAAACENVFIDTVEYTCAVVADFTPPSQSVALNTNITFTSTGSGATNYQWLVNGSLSGTGTSFTYSFTNPGSNSIQLIAGNGICSATKYGYIDVLDSCGNQISLFQKSYRMDQILKGVDIKPTADGGAISVISKLVPGVTPDAFNANLLKTDANGNVLWNKRYGLSNRESYFNKVSLSADGGFIAIGYIYNALSPDIFIVKTDISGNIIWTKSILWGNGGFSQGTNIIQGSDGYYYFSAYSSTSGITYGSDNIIGKLDNAGNIVWINLYDIDINDYCYGITEDNNAIAVCGTINDGSQNVATKAFILKVNKADGSVQWTKTYQSVEDEFKDIQTLNDGYYINAAARVTQAGYKASQVYLKTDKNGNVIFSKFTRPFGNNIDIFRSSSLMKNDRKIVCLASEYATSLGNHTVVQEIDPVNGIVWSRTYNNKTWLSDIENSGSNILWMTGLKFGSATGNNTGETLIIKADSLGHAGTCPDNEINLELMDLRYNIKDIIVQRHPLQTTQITNYIASDISVVVNTLCETLPCPIDTCKTYTCKIDSLRGDTSICNFSQSHTYNVFKTGNCGNISWNINPAFADIVSENNNDITISFKKTGSVWLYASIPNTCIDIKDSILIQIKTPLTKPDLGPDINLCKESTIELHAGFVRHIYGRMVLLIQPLQLISRVSIQ